MVSTTVNTAEMYSSGQVARQLGMPRWRLQYLIERGDFPSPSQVVAGRRLFSSDDIVAMRLILTARVNDGASGPAASTSYSE